MILVDTLNKICGVLILFFILGAMSSVHSYKSDQCIIFNGIIIGVVCVLLAGVYIFGKTISREEFEAKTKAEATKYDIDLTIDFGLRSRLTPFDLERQLWVIHRLGTRNETATK